MAPYLNFKLWWEVAEGLEKLGDDDFEIDCMT